MSLEATGRMRDRIANIRTQFVLDEVKIFFVGFNKCGTTSLHNLLTKSGINSVHYHYPCFTIDPFAYNRPLRKHFVNIASEIERRDGENLKRLLSRFTAFSDMFYFSDHAQIEAVTYFRRFHDLYPDAYFILNDRDEAAWLASRRNHDGGSLLARAMAFYKVGAEEVLDIWRDLRRDHHADVLEYFEGNPRFLHFRIDQDPIERFAEHIGEHYRVDPRDWLVLNPTLQS